MTYIVATTKKWDIKKFRVLKKKGKKNRWILIASPSSLTTEKLKKLSPRYVFFPHWSWIIPKKIWSKFECVVFHMTDLPYGRGGTPLQNLIARGHMKTKISAFKGEGGIDEGPVYIKHPFSLHGSAQEIYERLSGVIFSRMIPKIIRENPVPKIQRGKIVTFKRRTPEMSRIPKGLTFSQLYDYMRMLDAEGYPKSFISHDGFRFEFSNACMVKNKLISYVTVTKL